MAADADLSLELSEKEMHDLVERSMERIVAHISSLPRQPVSDVEGGQQLAQSLKEPLPEAGQPAEELLDLVFERALSKSFNTASPGYLAYIPGGGLFHAAAADLIAGAVNRYVGVWMAAPGLVQIESNVIRWFCDIVGYPASAGGLLTTGGSLANLIALITARRERLPEDFLKGVVYGSDQTHHSVEKAAVLAGFPAARVRSVSSNSSFQMNPEKLEAMIARDRFRGLTPFLLVGNAGTTNTGAVDDLEALGRLSAREGLWFHVDGAYGGFFMLTGRGRRVMKGLERADSLTLDPHKGLFLPYGTGCLLVRDAGTLKRTHSVFADYMPTMQEEEDRIDYCQLSPELSRDFRGLRIWLPFKMHGAGVFRRNLEEKLELSRWAEAELARIPGIEIVAPAQLSTTVFRLVKKGLSVEDTNRLNRDLLKNINDRQHVYLTPTVVHGKFVIRICVLSFRTHRDRMERALEDIRQAVGEVLL